MAVVVVLVFFSLPFSSFALVGSCFIPFFLILFYSLSFDLYRIFLSVSFIMDMDIQMCLHHNKNCWAVIEIWRTDTYKWIFLWFNKVLIMPARISIHYIRQICSRRHRPYHYDTILNDRCLPMRTIYLLLYEASHFTCDRYHAHTHTYR